MRNSQVNTMQWRKTLAACLAVSLFSTSVFAALTKIEDDYMQNVEDTNKSLANNVALKDAKGATSDAKELAQMFAEVEDFYQRQGDAPDAVQLSKKSKDLSVEITKLVAAKDFDTAEQKAAEISRACKSCHNFYKKS